MSASLAPTNAPAPALSERHQKAVSLKAWMESDNIKDAIMKALPTHMDKTRFHRVLLNLCLGNPMILDCTKQSLYLSVLRCAANGVEPDGRMAHIIPYRQKDGTYQATFQWDFKGMADMIRRSGLVSVIEADVVYDADEFEMSRGCGGRLFHRPNLKTKTPGEIYCAYSYVKMKDGSESYIAMRRDELEAIRDRSEGWQAYQAGRIKTTPWQNSFGEMCKKTVFKRHAKLLPFSAQLREQLMDDEDQVDNGFVAAKPIIPVTVVADFPTQDGDSGEDLPASMVSLPHPSEQPSHSEEVASTPTPSSPDRPADLNKASPGELLLGINHTMSTDGVTENALMEYLIRAKVAKPEQKLADLAQNKLVRIYEGWPTILKAIKG